MTTTKKRERFSLWLTVYDALGPLRKKGVSKSQVLQEAIDHFKEPSDRPKKVRDFTIEEKRNKKIQAIADKWFKLHEDDAHGNRSDALQYIIEEYIKNQENK
jgi:hypothetical protein